MNSAWNRVRLVPQSRPLSLAFSHIYGLGRQCDVSRQSRVNRPAHGLSGVHGDTGTSAENYFELCGMGPRDLCVTTDANAMIDDDVTHHALHRPPRAAGLLSAALSIVSSRNWRREMQTAFSASRGSIMPDSLAVCTTISRPSSSPSDLDLGPL